MEVNGGSGAETERRCFDTRGRSWTENCTLWDEGGAYAFRVNTQADDYPYPIARLQGQWSLSVEAGGTRVDMRFEVSPKAGLMNGLLLRLMAGPFARLCDRLLVNWIAVMEDRAGPLPETRPRLADTSLAQPA